MLIAKPPEESRSCSMISWRETIYGREFILSFVLLQVGGQFAPSQTVPLAPIAGLQAAVTTLEDELW